MTLHTSTPSSCRRGFGSSAGLLGALLAVPVLLSAPPAAADRERGMPDQGSGTSVSVPSSAPSVAPSAPRSAPAPSSPSASPPSRVPASSGGGVVRAEPRGDGGRETTSSRSGEGSRRGPGYVSTGPRGPGVDRHHRPPRRYYAPSVRWGTSWWWGGPWDWWWWGAGWGHPWGWGGVTVIRDFDPLPHRYARVDTDVSPEAAEVYLDGTSIGSADDFDGFPDYLYLEPGKYRLEFRHPSYETLVKELEVRRGQQVRLNDDMKLLPGKKRMDAFDPERKGTPLGRVFGKGEGDRKERGDRTGRFEAKSEPDAGKVDDLDELDDLDEDVPPPARPAPSVPPKAGAEEARPDLDEIAPAERGRLRLEIEPDDAAVYLDDRYVGTAEELAGLRRGLSVRPGKHTVTVVRPGYGTKTVDVEAKPGAAIDVVIELEK